MPSPVAKKPQVQKSFKKAVAKAKKSKLPLLISYDVPLRIVQDKVRKLVNDKKLIYLNVTKGNDVKLLKNRYALRSLELCLCDKNGNKLKSNLLDFDQVDKAITDMAKLKETLKSEAETHLKEAKKQINDKEFSQACQSLSAFAYLEGDETFKEGKKLFSQMNDKAKLAYDALLKKIQTKKINKKNVLKNFMSEWPNTTSFYVAQKSLNLKEEEKPFIGYCPISPKAISYLKFRIEHKGMRYYMCCVGCLATSKKRPKILIDKLKKMREKLVIK